MDSSPTLRIKFIQAAKEGKLEIIKKYIEEGISVNTVDNCGVFLFFYSILHYIGLLHMVKLI